MKKYTKGNITLQLRVPVDFAVSILGRLYGMGILSREDYMKRLEKVSKLDAENEQKKSEKLENLLKKASKKRGFVFFK